jgi:hypothetical protein
MSSHREAPEISKDPVADNTDTYAFVSPDKPDTVTIIANYIPLQDPAGGPNFYEFGDDVSYRIKINNSGDAHSDITYEFRFTTKVRNPDTFLYNTGPIGSLDDPNFNRPQTYTVTRWRAGQPTVLGEDLLCPPCNVGLRSTPDYPNLGKAAVHSIDEGIKVFAGQRLDGFYVDLGSAFDLGTLRPFQSLHLIPTPNQDGINALRAFNVHTIAMQIPIKNLTRDGSTPKDPMKPEAVLGIWASAARQKGAFRGDTKTTLTGPFKQVSRLGNPLFNEVIVPMSEKDVWNFKKPQGDSHYAKYVAQPELARLLPVLYPGVFPNLAALKADRADLLAILLTGIPAGLIAGFQNYTGDVQADMLRLNVAIPPAKTPNINGIIGGDLAGFPNGRRHFDNVVAIELRAIAGVTYPLVDPSYVPDAAAGAIYDVTDSKIPGTVTYLKSFPYLDHPVSGTDVIPLKKGAESGLGVA